jgi:hypothetical protein
VWLDGVRPVGGVGATLPMEDLPNGDGKDRSKSGNKLGRTLPLVTSPRELLSVW